MAPERHYVSDEEWERMDTNERFQATPQLVDWMKHLKPLEPTLSPEEKEQIAEDARLLARLQRIDAHDQYREQEGETSIESGP